MKKKCDLLLRNATIIDGTGGPRFSGDIGIRGDRIAHIGDLSALHGDVEIDLGGRIAAPGFIDAHTHDDRLMRPIPQPVTPPLNLLDDQGGWFHFKTFAEYIAALRAQPAATNCALLVGHTTLRVATMDNLGLPANAAQIASMRTLVHDSLAAGAIGVSTGLFYEPAIAAPTEEVIETCRPLKEFGGLYCTHMRAEADGVMDSLEETFRIGREVGVPVVISHHKVIGQANYGRSAETLAFIKQSMAKQAVCLDCYPYTAGSTILSADRAASSTRVIVTWSKSLPEYAGQDLADIAKKMGVSEEQAVARLNPAGAIYFRMDEADVQRILQFDETMIGSDGLPHDAAPHPRLWGSFPRVLGHYGRTLGLFPLEKAVHKMTGLTAKNFGLKDRGVLKEDAYADLTLFDADTVAEAATYEAPIANAHGIDTVIVNGAIVWRDGRSTGARPGRVLTH